MSGHGRWWGSGMGRGVRRLRVMCCIPILPKITENIPEDKGPRISSKLSCKCNGKCNGKCKCNGKW
jgi:hypothetical protein